MRKFLNGKVFLLYSVIRMRLTKPFIPACKPRAKVAQNVAHYEEAIIGKVLICIKLFERGEYSFPRIDSINKFSSFNLIIELWKISN